MKINILDENTINKIAAGEVVERPSSIIKELVENSIDSGATKVTIEIKDGGKSLIKITDNGCGIKSSEVDKSILRHATSKIKNVDDLYDLYSLGFRGEALSSICAVSKFEMITKSKDESIGTKLVVHGGRKISKEAVGCSIGTTITITDVFYNVPARAKFLKSNVAESINITELVNKLSITNPNIVFKFINNSKTILQTPGDKNLINTIRTIHGREICDNLIRVESEDELLKLSGFIGNNNIYRSNRNFQYVCINKRLVKSKLITDVLDEVYKGIVPINKHSIVFLNISLNPKTIDVNIHPTKLEVKFENEKEISFKLKEILKSFLLNTNLVGKFSINETKKLDKSKNLQDTKENGNSKSQDYKNDFLEATSEKINTKNFTDNKNQEDIIKYQKVDIENIKPLNIEENNLEKFKIFDEVICEKEDETYQNETLLKDKNDILNNTNLKKDINFKKEENIKEKDVTQEVFFKEKRLNFLDFNIVGTLFDTYIILSCKDKMYLMDQHAVHEKIIYENYIQNFKQKEINMQMLLEPIIISLNNSDFIKIEENIDLFYKFGFEIEIFGKNHIMIRSVPNMFENTISEKFILEIIDNIENVNSSYDLKEEKIISMACKKAIKANYNINNFEIKDLLKKLNEAVNPFTCPHGRPTIIEITKKDIEKMFKRII